MNVFLKSGREPVDEEWKLAQSPRPMKKLLSLLAAVALTQVSAFAGEFPEISKDELTKVIAAKTVTVIDVNGTSSWKDGHIPGALDFVAVKADLKSKLPADKGALVVAYCGGETCGAYTAAASAAKSLGYTNVKHFKPGISGWVASGAATEKGK